jgi:L-malate glycosyltransferase
MNVVFLTPWYPTNENRYAAVFVREYAKVVQRHHNVIVLHCDNGDPTLQHWWAATKQSDEELSDGVISYSVAFKPSRFRFWSFARYLGSVYRTVTELSRAHGRPDLIHAHVFTTGWAALLIGKLGWIPVVISEHWSAFPRGILSRSPIYQARLIFRLADAVLPVSHALQRSLEHYGVKAKFQVVPNVVDTDLFAYSPRASGSSPILRLLAVTSLVEYKGLFVLFQALKQVAWQGRRWRLDVVGDGAEAAEHHLMVVRLGLAANVAFHGALAKKEVAQMMRQADLFVLPSLVETFSVATAEALACGVPCVVTRCGGPEEFVTEGSGTVAEPNDAPAFAAALTRTIERLPTFNRPAIAEDASARFGSAHVGAMLDDLYARLAHNRSRLA